MPRSPSLPLPFFSSSSSPDDPVIAGLDPAIQGSFLRTCSPWMPGSSPGHDDFGGRGVALVSPTPLGYEGHRVGAIAREMSSMDTEAPRETPRHGGNAFVVFITSISAAIVVAGGVGVVRPAVFIAPAQLFALG